MVTFNLIHKLKKDKQKGQGMTEYILIVLLIAIALIAVFGVFRNKLKTGVTTASEQIQNVITESEKK